MDLDYRSLLEALFRWGHVVAGVTWIGLLYFFNWVNGPFAGTMDGPTKQKVIPELVPRTLFWFRWGAAWTWIFGVLLLGLVYYMAKTTMFEGYPVNTWSAGSGLMVALVFASPFIYDPLAKSGLGKNNKNFAWLCLVLVAAVVMAFIHVGHLSYRAYNIHLGAMFGTIMAFNVWFRIWPAQQKIIAAIKAGTPPDAALAALAGQRSRHNTYMSVPLIWAMINAHTTAANFGVAGVNLIVIVALGWWGVMQCYAKAAKVKGM